jgi:Mlc titration factor MtfA (ptsG expression regulator)
MKTLIIALWIILIIYLAYLLYNYYSYKKLIKQLKTIPFPKEYENILEKIPQYKNLPKDLQTKIKYSILLFIKTKKFIGVKLNVTDEMKIVISFFACLIVINKNECYDNLEYIYIYPHKMILDTIQNNGGIYNKEMFIISGEAVGDSVIIAWDEAKKEAYHLKKHNVIIHEFTHELDFESGIVDGVPNLAKSQYNEWIQILGNSYQEFKNKIINHKSLDKYKLIDKYGATNEAEFFAVLSEMFWTNPKTLKTHFPKTYKEFVKFFNFNPNKIQ